MFTKAKRYTVDGVCDISDLSEDDNLIIKGNNLLVISSLMKVFSGKVSCVYIDPPYYFKNNKPADAFRYNSNFKLSSWLVFIKNRFAIAKKIIKREWCNIVPHRRRWSSLPKNVDVGNFWRRKLCRNIYMEKYR